MSQPTTWNVPTSGPSSMGAYATRDNESFNALLSLHSGNSAPSYAVQGTLWLDTDGGTSPADMAIKIYDGATWITVFQFDTSGNTIQVETGNIKDLAVTSAKLADLAVTAAKLASDAVTSAKLADNAIDRAEVVQAAFGTSVIIPTDYSNAGYWSIDSSAGITVRDRNYSSDTKKFSSQKVLEFAGSASDSLQRVSFYFAVQTPVQPGAVYEVIVPIHTLSNPADDLQIGADWRDDSDTNISTTFQSFDYLEADGTNPTYKRIFLTAPDGAKSARWYIARAGTNTAGTWLAGHMLVNVVAFKKTQSDQLQFTSGYAHPVTDMISDVTQWFNEDPDSIVVRDRSYSANTQKFERNREVIELGENVDSPPNAVRFIRTQIAYSPSVVAGGKYQVSVNVLPVSSPSDTVQVTLDFRNSSNSSVGTSTVTLTNANANASDITRIIVTGVAPSGSEYCHIQISRVGTTAGGLWYAGDVRFVELGEMTVPLGGVIFRAGSTVPAGFLECNGSAVSRTTYRQLFNLVGTTFGTGDGSTTFNLPNLSSAFANHIGLIVY